MHLECEVQIQSIVGEGGEMAKKKADTSEPIISSIPVPPSDSALVIDLPDGQKLLVGKIENGTVIEVATWRGTGRPDSRTNRLMLGMSNEQDVKKEHEVEPSPPLVAKDLKFPQNMFFMMSKLGNISFSIAKKIILNIVKKLKSIDFKNLRFSEIKLPKLKLPVLKNKVAKLNEDRKVLVSEEDFEIDFQRILDEVSQRRSSNPGNATQTKGTATKKVSQKSKNREVNTKKRSI